MSAPISKSDLTFHLPQSFSYHSTWDDADYEPAKPLSLRERLVLAFQGAQARLARWSDRRVALTELSGMSDRELSDIGLTRSDITRVTDPSFIDEYAGRGLARG